MSRRLRRCLSNSSPSSVRFLPSQHVTVELTNVRNYAATWTVDALVARIGVKDKPSATKALGTWIELGVLRLADAHAGLYELLEVAETGRKNKTSARQAGKHHLTCCAGKRGD
jgi:hypothetical protein